MNNWDLQLAYYQEVRPPLLEAAFMDRWGAEKWEPADADRAAAGELHTQLISRVTVQPLGYSEGDAAAALRSVYLLFQKARKIADRHPGARHYDRLVWQVLNTHVRPFTAHWHPLYLARRLDALDATDEFRAGLARLQSILRRFDLLLLEIRDGIRPCPEPTYATPSYIADEMRRPLEWSVDPIRGNIPADVAGRMNAFERKAVETRRKNYGLDADRGYATGLALSGGGIRSATFSLGVLAALAKRNLLPEFDYMSSVSGGGYLGAFLMTFLSTPTLGESARIGLRTTDIPFRRDAGEAEALRYIRHRSKFLQTSLRERLGLVSSQIYGMVVNLSVISLLPGYFALIEFLVRQAPIPDKWSRWLFWTPLTLAVLTGAVLPYAASRIHWLRSRSDRFAAWAAAAVIALVGWEALGAAHRVLAGSGWWALPGPGLYPLVFAAALPLSASVATVLLPRKMKPLRMAIGVLAALAAPSFLVEIELLVYAWLSEGSGLSASVEWPRAVVIAGLLLLVVVATITCLDVNFTSPHRHYRRKLAETFMIRPAKQQNGRSPSEAGILISALRRCRRRLAEMFSIRPSEQHTEGSRFEAGVSVKLSQCLAGERAPYPLVNCALNLPGSLEPAMQGRLTDFFLFSPGFCGSSLTGFHPTTEWEEADPDLDLGTAMAISGAAASPLMGLGTRRFLRFWLALLNVRLGYWIRKPKLETDGFRKWLVPKPSLFYLLREMFGLIDERLPFLNVTDGGHIENLGVYELLRRQCKYIVAVDGEHDQAMTFHGFTNLQRLASIDLGVSIEVDLDDLRLAPDGLSRSHFKFCRIRYPLGDRGAEEGCGYLIYVKLSLTGNEGEFLRRYRLDEPLFPHHPTADQFFTEAQFEAYRSLGEHVGDTLFMEAMMGDGARDGRMTIERWFAALGHALLR